MRTNTRLAVAAAASNRFVDGASFEMAIVALAWNIKKHLQLFGLLKVRNF